MIEAGDFEPSGAVGGNRAGELSSGTLQSNAPQGLLPEDDFAVGMHAFRPSASCFESKADLPALQGGNW